VLVSFDTLIVRIAYLELSHDWGNLIFQPLVCHFASTQIDLVANEDDRDLASARTADDR